MFSKISGFQLFKKVVEREEREEREERKEREEREELHVTDGDKKAVQGWSGIRWAPGHSAQITR